MAVAQPVHLGALTAVPRTPQNRGAADVRNLLQHNEFDQPPPAILVAAPVEPRVVFVRDVLDVAQPVVGESSQLALGDRVHAAAAVMANNHDVLDLQCLDGVLQRRQAVQVRMHHKVGDDPVCEHLAGRARGSRWPTRG